MDARPASSRVNGAVVVGLDGTSSADQALDWAVAQVLVERRPLVLATATGAPDVEATTRAGPDQLMRLAGALCALNRELYVRTFTIADDPIPALTRLARDAHLLVLGSRGHRGPDLPTVGVQVSGLAACPVVVVPEIRPGGQQGVLAGVDPGEESPAVLEFAFRQAKLHGWPLTIVTGDGSQEHLDATRRWLAESLLRLRALHPDVANTTVVLGGWPMDRLLRMAERMHLLVVGRQRALRADGDVAGDVVGRARCPTALVPVAHGEVLTPAMA